MIMVLHCMCFVDLGTGPVPPLGGTTPLALQALIGHMSPCIMSMDPSLPSECTTAGFLMDCLSAMAPSGHRIEAILAALDPRQMKLSWLPGKKLCWSQSRVLARRQSNGSFFS